jgi:ribulose-5-phosphate 4-epimerase/fuculose-1-phosphate aldolase
LAPPVYDSGDRLRNELTQLGAEVVGAGLVVGSGGNLSARVPGEATCLVTAAGAWLDRLTPADFVRVSIDTGAPVDRDASDDGDESTSAVLPSSELALHLHTYRARPDVNAIVHLHPQSVLLLDAIGERIRLVSTDHAYYVRRVARVGFHPPGTVALAEAAAAAVADGVNCVVLAHHGCSVVADTVALAHRRVRNLEEAAQLTYRALALGRGDLSECPREFLDHLDIDPPMSI